ncbi:MAG TPA: kelch repeat-containing protein, partial [Anaerolineales bacterium]
MIPMKSVFSLFAICIVLFTSSCGKNFEPSPSAAWTQRPMMLTTRSENAAAVVGQIIYVPGGFGGEQKLEAYDTATDTWQTLADLPEPRHHLMSAAHDGRVFIFGGASSIVDWRPQFKAWVYDPSQDSWAEIASMPEPRLAGAAVTLGDFIYILGGTGGT